MSGSADPVLPRLDDLLAGVLDEDDDGVFWDVAIRTILGEIDGRLESMSRGIRGLEVGFHKVRRWRSPNQARWTAGGGFAWPESYATHAEENSEKSLWVAREGKAGSPWLLLDRGQGRRSAGGRFRAFVSLPAYTRRHSQGAVIILWRPRGPWKGEGHKGVTRELNGFRKDAGGAWRRVAVQEYSESRKRDR
jgi:hypothetical protein